VEEIIVATDSLPFEDYVTARKHHMVSSVFWNDSWFDVLVQYARNFGFKCSEWWSSVLPAMEKGSPEIRGFLNEFVDETVNELFPTREACVRFYSENENFEKLKNGQIGDNLMYRYRAIASFRLWDAVCSTAMDSTRCLLERQGLPDQYAHFDEFWADLCQFVRLRHASGESPSEILSSKRATLRYDLPRWAGDGCPTGFANYRLDEPAEFEFGLSEESGKELAAALQVWGTEIKSLSKMVTRIKVEWQVRDCAPVCGNTMIAVAE
jgi:hypothetical protein